MKELVEDKLQEIRDLLNEGFYPEEYIQFTSKIEDLLEQIEEAVISYGI